MIGILLCTDIVKMGLKEDLSNGMMKIIETAGTPMRIQYFTQTAGSVWDDDTTLAQSGTDLWTSGVVLPINAHFGQSEGLLVEQGKLLSNDQKLYMHGSVLSVGSEFKFKVGMGSPIGGEYSLVGPAIIAPEVESTPIYRKVYIRRLTNGSLVGQ